MLKCALLSKSIIRFDARRHVSMACSAGDSSKSIAVIGAGAAGLVAAREMRREGHRVTVYEQASQVGGIWVYTDAYEADDLLGLNKERGKVHGSLYSSLRTNLPRHVMAFTDFPFDFQSTGSEDDRLYCGHQEVLKYLQLFDKAFKISSMVQFETLVREIEPLRSRSAVGNPRSNENGNDPPSELPRWRIRTEHKGQQSETDFDAVVVCNGHYSEPRVPDLPGGRGFPGRQLHTHNFRDSSSFAGLRVVIMGASASGQDIAREIAEVADTVFFSARSMQFGSKVINWESSDEGFGARSNMFRRAAIARLEADGSVIFADGDRAKNIDAVVFATGYKFSFPFLEKSGAVIVSDNRVQPLYQHVICTSRTSLAFIGLPWQVIPFPMMELQSRWVARILSGRSLLPSRTDMEKHTEEFYRKRAEDGVPVRYSHRLGEEQWAYNSWLLEQMGADPAALPGWRPRMHKSGQANIREKPDSYRDTWTDFGVLEESEREARKWRHNSVLV